MQFKIPTANVSNDHGPKRSFQAQPKIRFASPPPPPPPPGGGNGGGGGGWPGCDHDWQPEDANKIFQKCSKCKKQRGPLD